MAASSLLLRSLVLASSHRAQYTAGFSLHPTPFLQLRAETLNFRGSHLSCRSFSAQVLEVSEPVLESKKKKLPTSSWEEAGAAFFSKKGKNVAEGGNAVEQRDERKGVSAPERVQSRSSQRYAEEGPVVKRNFERKTDNAFSDGKFDNSRNAPRDFDNSRNAPRNGSFARRESADMDSGRGAFGRGRGGSAGRNGSFARSESADMDSGRGAFGRGRGGFAGRNGSFARRESVDMDSGRGDFDRGRGGFTGRNGSFARRESADMDSGRGDFDRGRGGFTGRNGSFARRESAGMDSGRGAYGGRGFREELSDVGDDNRENRWNARSGADGRNRWNAKSDAGSRGFKDGYADDKAAYRSDGAFRKEFGDSVDTSKGFFRNRNQGGTFGKKQFPDIDGGKRLFKGRFEGDGFVKKQMHGNEGGNDDNGREKASGTSKRGQSFSKGSSGARVQKQVEDDLEGEASSEDDEDESDGFPQAGDVIRRNEMVSASRDSNRRQSPVDAHDSEGELQDEDESQVELDEDEDEDEDVDDGVHKRRGFESARRELPLMSSSLPKIIGEVVYGVGPVYAALQVSRREFFCLYVQQNMPIGGGNAGKKKDKKAVEWIIRTAIDRGLEVKEVKKHDLNMLADNRPHQGLILDASPLELVISTHLEAAFAENGKTPVWVALDEVTDPQNFGAILRSAYFLGAKGVVVCAKNSAPLSAVVSKASAGALEVMELRSCKNMMKFLDRSTENGWWVVGGSAAGTDVTSVRELPRGLPTILVLGGEGKGLRTNVKRSCSELVCIPGLPSESQGKRGSLPNKVQEAVDADVEDNEHQHVFAREDFNAVESLNVSVAAGILLHELLNNQAATESSSKKHSEIDVEAVQHSKGDVEAMSSDEQEQHREIDVQAVSSDEQEQHRKIDVEAVLSYEQEQHHEIDAKAVSSDEQEQCSQITATD